MRYVNIQPPPAVSGERHLIFNADDFGVSRGVNRGIIECHRHGVLTSTSLTVAGRAVEEAAALSRQNPALAVGLHFDVWGEGERQFDIRDLAATREEFQRQLDQFFRIMGRPPTHVDSHQHAHRLTHLFEHFREWVAPLGVPLRGGGQIRFTGGFYAQWQWQVTDLFHVSVPFLQEMLRKEVLPGFTEFSCHPGYVSDDYRAVYYYEREAELATLIDPRVRSTIDELGIRLISYAEYVKLQQGVA